MKEQVQVQDECFPRPDSERDALLGPDGLARGSPSGLEYMPLPAIVGAQEGGAGWPFQKRVCIQLTWASLSKVDNLKSRRQLLQPESQVL